MEVRDHRNKIVVSVQLAEYGSKKLELDEELRILENDFIQGSLEADYVDNVCIVSADIECISYPYDYFRAFDSERGLELAFSLEHVPFRALAIRKSDPFWTKPMFFSELRGEDGRHIQQLLLHVQDKYIHVMPLADEGGISEIAYEAANQRFKLSCNICHGGMTAIKRPLAVISEAADPYEAIEKTYEAAYKAGLVKTPLKREKQYPGELEGLGWCTWNAFYHEVTESGIREKLEEFRQKGIALDWLIIDDGWSIVKDFKLQAFEEDRKKFPSGFKEFIAEIKQEYGVKAVGVWHAFTGYWFGIEKDSSLYLAQKENLEETPAGLIIPSGEYEKAYAFYHTWHQYLKSRGVDFLKVDTQGNALEFLRGIPGAAGKVMAMHEALEQSVADCFGGAMINCMGLGSLDTFYRNRSSVVRSSGDFFPDKENGFCSHIEQNAYNAVFLNPLYYCDYDMWWTKHLSAKQSSVLRSISGGPIYVSDRVGETDAFYLKQLSDPDGTIPRYEDAARPTLDCLFGYDEVLKLYNKIGNEYVIAVFNLSDREICAELSLRDVGQTGGNVVSVVVKPQDVEVIKQAILEG